MHIKSKVFLAVLVFTIRVFGQGYSINLMWVNNGKEKSKFIYSDEEEILKEKLLKVVFSWAELNPGRDVNIWYDSEYVVQMPLRIH